MPTASTAQILGNNESFEPYTSNMYNRRVLSGEFTVVNKYLLKDLMKIGLWPKIKNQLIAHNGSVQNIAGVRAAPPPPPHPKPSPALTTNQCQFYFRPRAPRSLASAAARWGHTLFTKIPSEPRHPRGGRTAPLLQSPRRATVAVAEAAGPRRCRTI
jgi:hypothetical protein